MQPDNDSENDRSNISIPALFGTNNRGFPLCLNDPKILCHSRLAATIQNIQFVFKYAVLVVESCCEYRILFVIAPLAISRRA